MAGIMIRVEATRAELIANAAELGLSAIGDPDLGKEQAESAVKLLAVTIPTYEALALIGSTSSSDWYRMNEDLPAPERAHLKEARHYLTVLRAIHPGLS